MLPLVSMFKFSTNEVGPRTRRKWDALEGACAKTSSSPPALKTSLELAVLGPSSAVCSMLLPTMIWIRLKVPVGEEAGRVHQPAASDDSRDRAW